MTDIVNHEFEPDDFSPLTIINRNPDQFEHYVSFDEAVVLSCNDGFQHRALTRAWEPIANSLPNFGYYGPKATAAVLNSVIIDAFLAYGDGAYVHYSRSKSGNPAYLGIGYERLMTALDFLIQNGLIHNFIVPATTHTPIRSFLCATPKLAQLCEGKIAMEDLALKPDLWSIQCTVRKSWEESGGKYISSKRRTILRDDKFIPCNLDVIAQNKFLQASNIGFEPPKSQLRGESEWPFVTFETSKGRITTLNIMNVCQRRVFVKNTNESEDYYGGRFYGGCWQSQSKEDRRFFTFDGRPAGHEFDFRAMHAHIGYAILNQPAPINPYFAKCSALEVFASEEDRTKICKIAFFMAINARTLRGAAGALATKMIEIAPEAFGFTKKRIFPPSGIQRVPLLHEERKRSVAIAKEIIEAVIRHNSPIKDFICSDMGVRFQKIDSEIMAIGQRRCREEGIPILGVHDSFLAPFSKTARAKQIFGEEFITAIERLREGGLCAYEIDCPSKMPSDFKFVLQGRKRRRVGE